MNFNDIARMAVIQTLKESLTDEAYTAIMDEAESLLESGVATNEADAINFAASNLVDVEAQELIEAVINESLDAAKKHLNTAIAHGKSARAAYKSKATELGFNDGTLLKGNVAGHYLAKKAGQELGAAAKEAIKDKRVQAGVAGLGIAALAAKKLHDAKKVREAEKKDLDEGAVKELETILDGDAKTTKTSSRHLIDTVKRHAKSLIADDKRRNNPKKPLTEEDFIGESSAVMSAIWGTEEE